MSSSWGTGDFALHEPLCMGSVGISTREPWPPDMQQRRVYVFADRGWSRDGLQETVRSLRMKSWGRLVVAGCWQLDCQRYFCWLQSWHAALTIGPEVFVPQINPRSRRSLRRVTLGCRAGTSMRSWWSRTAISRAKVEQYREGRVQSTRTFAGRTGRAIGRSAKREWRRGPSTDG